MAWMLAKRKIRAEAPTRNRGCSWDFESDVEVKREKDTPRLLPGVLTASTIGRENSYMQPLETNAEVLVRKGMDPHTKHHIS